MTPNDGGPAFPGIGGEVSGPKSERVAMNAQPLLPLSETAPRYWIARRCPHWSPEQNRRFRLYRLDGPTDHVGRYPGAVWDADRKQWLDQRRLGGIGGHELARPATLRDLKGVPLTSAEQRADPSTASAPSTGAEP